MSTRTHSLSLLVVLSAAFPAQLFRVGLALTAQAASPRRRLWALLRPALLPAALLAVAVLVWYLAPSAGVTTGPSAWWWLAVAVAAGVAAPAWEIGAAAGVAWARGRRIGPVRMHERWPGGTATALATAVVVAVAEEIIFRGVGITLLVHALGSPVVVAVALTAAVYALNHLYFGWLTVGQKLLTGGVFGALYVLSGESLLVPLLAHVLQNVVVLAVLPRWGVRP